MRKQIWDTIIKQSQYIVVCESVVTQTKSLCRHSYLQEEGRCFAQQKLVLYISLRQLIVLMYLLLLLQEK